MGALQRIAIPVILLIGTSLSRVFTLFLMNTPFTILGQAHEMFRVCYLMLCRILLRPSISMTQALNKRDEPLIVGITQRALPVPADHPSTCSRHEHEHNHSRENPHRQRSLPEDRLHGEDISLRAMCHTGEAPGALRRRNCCGGMHYKARRTYGGTALTSSTTSRVPSDFEGTDDTCKSK